MITYSIEKEVNSFDSEKIYLKNFITDSYELGFGKAGEYLGHSHYYFNDIVYAPSGINCGNKIYKLIIVPPRTFLSNIEIEKFFFIKFISQKCKITLPDKTNKKLSDGRVRYYNSNMNYDTNFYNNSKGEQSEFKLSLVNNELNIIFDRNNYFRIIK